MCVSPVSRWFLRSLLCITVYNYICTNAVKVTTYSQQWLSNVFKSKSTNILSYIMGHPYFYHFGSRSTFLQRILLIAHCLTFINSFKKNQEKLFKRITRLVSKENFWIANFNVAILWRFFCNYKCSPQNSFAFEEIKRRTSLSRNAYYFFLTR